MSTIDIPAETEADDFTHRGWQSMHSFSPLRLAKRFLEDRENIERLRFTAVGSSWLILCVQARAESHDTTTMSFYLADGRRRTIQGFVDYSLRRSAEIIATHEGWAELSQFAGGDPSLEKSRLFVDWSFPRQLCREIRRIHSAGRVELSSGWMYSSALEAVYDLLSNLADYVRWSVLDNNTISEASADKQVAWLNNVWMTIGNIIPRAFACKQQTIHLMLEEECDAAMRAAPPLMPEPMEPIVGPKLSGITTAWAYDRTHADRRVAIDDLLAKITDLTGAHPGALVKPSWLRETLGLNIESWLRSKQADGIYKEPHMGHWTYRLKDVVAKRFDDMLTAYKNKQQEHSEQQRRAAQ